MSDETKAVILAAGLGSRLHPLTERVPKCLVPIGGRPLLEYWIDLLQEAHIRKALINTHALAEQVREYIGRINQRGGILLQESYEPELLGSAGTLAANAAFADGAREIVVIYSDNLSDVNLNAMLSFHRAHGDPFTMMLFRAKDPKACGIAELDADYRVIAFVEKPREPRSNLANAGVYIINAKAYQEIARMRCFDLGHEVLARFVGRMRGWLWTGYHLDIGTHEAYSRTQAEVMTANFQGPAAPATGLKPAVFLDRDGTLIVQEEYLSDPGRVKLLPGVTEALKRLRRAGFALVLVSNQSAIGRGLMSEEDQRRVNQEFLRQLASEGVGLDGIYHCPMAPRFSDRTVVEHPDRKPGPGMLLRAARELGLDLRRSWMIGDLLSDVYAGYYARCRGSILVRTGQRLGADENGGPIRFHLAADLTDAVKIIFTAGS